MIEIVSAAACIACDVCVKVCPTDVFDRGADGVPVIARQSDCQTCFACEAYCPEDALYVAPEAYTSVRVDEVALTLRGELGSYREAIGWGPGRTPVTANDPEHILHRLIERTIR